MLARLHVITNDDIVARAKFVETATALMTTYGSAIVLHVRMKRAHGADVYATADALQHVAADTATTLIVNDRLDVALGIRCAGVQLGAASVPVMHARRLAPDTTIGYSAHGVGEARKACDDGADFLLLGTIWASSSHPGECGAGVDLLRRAAEGVGCPVFAIGGVTPARAQEAVLAGAYGVAAISSVWNAVMPVDAVKQYLDAIRDVT